MKHGGIRPINFIGDEIITNSVYCICSVRYGVPFSSSPNHQSQSFLHLLNQPSDLASVKILNQIYQIKIKITLLINNLPKIFRHYFGYLPHISVPRNICKQFRSSVENHHQEFSKTHPEPLHQFHPRGCQPPPPQNFVQSSRSAPHFVIGRMIISKLFRSVLRPRFLIPRQLLFGPSSIRSYLPGLLGMNFEFEVLWYLHFRTQIIATFLGNKLDTNKVSFVLYRGFCYCRPENEIGIQ